MAAGAAGAAWVCAVTLARSFAASTASPCLAAPAWVPIAGRAAGLAWRAAMERRKMSVDGMDQAITRRPDWTAGQAAPQAIRSTERAGRTPHAAIRGRAVA